MPGTSDLLDRRVESIYPSKSTLEAKLKKGEKLKIYFGIDPTSTKLHLGHSVPLLKLAQFQKEGHKIILLFGDFTATIGDPSGRTTIRKPLSKKEIAKNLETYKKQAEKILNFRENSPEIILNSTWWDKTSLRDFFKILSQYTVSQLIERDMFQTRIKTKKPVAASEFLYPVLQGYDSIALDVDLEIGGSEQTFNMLSGRTLMKRLSGKEKFVLTAPLIEGTDGRKMSKTYDNTIDLELPAGEMYGRLMSIEDQFIIKYFRLLTNIEESEIKKIEADLKRVNPKIIKKKLSFEIVSFYHGKSEAEKAQNEFERVFEKGERASEIQSLIREKSILPIAVANLLAESDLAESTSEVVRIAESGGLKVDGKPFLNAREKLTSVGKETYIDIGKRRQVKIIWR